MSPTKQLACILIIATVYTRRVESQFLLPGFPNQQGQGGDFATSVASARVQLGGSYGPPPGPPCAECEKRDRTTGQCIPCCHQCPHGQYRPHPHGHCVPLPEPPCPLGEYRPHPHGPCVPIPEPPCPLGEYRPHPHGPCVPLPEPPCPPGEYRPHPLDHCIPIPEPPCPPGEYRPHPHGHCIPFPEPPCPPGEYRPHPHGHCIPIPLPPCPHGQIRHPHHHQCVPIPCPHGFHHGPHGHCIPTPKHCPHGQHLGPHGHCVPDTTPQPPCPVCHVCDECSDKNIMVAVRVCLQITNEPSHTHNCLQKAGVSARSAFNLIASRNQPEFMSALMSEH